MKAGILGVGKYVPARVVTNEELERTLDTSDEWIRSRTGIEERRLAAADEPTSVLAHRAAQAALADAGIEAASVDLILVATVTGDSPFPSVANRIQHSLGASRAAAMDIGAACSGFIYALATAQQFIETGAYRYALVVGAERLSDATDWTDRNTAVLFGDGAGAVLLGPVADDRGILAFELGSDGGGGDLLRLNGPHIEMNGREVYKFAVRAMGDSAVRTVERAGLSKEQIDFIIPHQANIRIMDSAREKLGLPADKMSVSVKKHGNTSAASIPIALADEVAAGAIRDGDCLVLVGFGGGLTWGAAVLRWGRGERQGG